WSTGPTTTRRRPRAVWALTGARPPGRCATGWGGRGIATGARGTGDDGSRVAGRPRPGGGAPVPDQPAGAGQAKGDEAEAPAVRLRLLPGLVGGAGRPAQPGGGGGGGAARGRQGQQRRRPDGPGGRLRGVPGAHHLLGERGLPER